MNKEPLADVIQTALVFACRYSHNRQTGGAYAVVRAVKLCWDQLSDQTREQILEESFEATCNKDDWLELRKFAIKKNET